MALISASTKRRALFVLGSFIISGVAVHLLIPDSASSLQQYAFGFSHESPQVDTSTVSADGVLGSPSDAEGQEIDASRSDENQEQPLTDASLADHPSSYSISGSPSGSTVKLPRAERTTPVLTTEIEDPLDLQPIKNLCSKAQWREGPVFHYGPRIGRAKNIRNNFLNFILFAIEAGAAFILPDVIVPNHSDKDATHSDPPNTHFDYMFNPEYLRQALEDDCLQLQIFDTLDARGKVFPFQRVLTLDTHSFEPEGQEVSSIAHSEEWRTSLTEWLRNKLGIGNTVFQNKACLGQCYGEACTCGP